MLASEILTNLYSDLGIEGYNPYDIKKALKFLPPALGKFKQNEIQILLIEAYLHSNDDSPQGVISSLMKIPQTWDNIVVKFNHLGSMLLDDFILIKEEAHLWEQWFSHRIHFCVLYYYLESKNRLFTEDLIFDKVNKAFKYCCNKYSNFKGIYDATISYNRKLYQI